MSFSTTTNDAWIQGWNSPKKRTEKAYWLGWAPISSESPDFSGQHLFCTNRGLSKSVSLGPSTPPHISAPQLLCLKAILKKWWRNWFYLYGYLVTAAVLSKYLLCRNTLKVKPCTALYYVQNDNFLIGLILNSAIKWN